MKTKMFFLSFAFALSACKSSPKAPVESKPVALPFTIEEAVASPFRTPENRVRDVYRHPVETLTFFGLKPGMTVVEILPGQGWYMEILSPLLATNGHYIAALPPSNNEYFIKANEKISQWIKAHPVLENKIKIASFAPPAELAPAGSVDMIVTFRNVHNWMAKGNAQETFNSFFAALKPGGVLGLVEHRANPKSKADAKAKSGYVREADVIKMATKAGFKLAEKSEINANPKDTKNYPDGVWTLPPTLKLGDKDKDKYQAIGESDRMTLRFVKP